MGTTWVRVQVLGHGYTRRGTEPVHKYRPVQVLVCPLRMGSGSWIQVQVLDMWVQIPRAYPGAEEMSIPILGSGTGSESRVHVGVLNLCAHRGAGMGLPLAYGF